MDVGEQSSRIHLYACTHRHRPGLSDNEIEIRQPFDSDVQIPALRMCVSAQMSSSCLTYHAPRKTPDPVYMLQLSARDFFLNEAVATSYEFR